jgi:hypothetical protein
MIWKEMIMLYFSNGQLADCGLHLARSFIYSSPRQVSGLFSKISTSQL